MTVRKSLKSRVKNAQRKEQKVKRKLMHAQLVTQNARLVMRNEELEEQIAELQRQVSLLKNLEPGLSQDLQDKQDSILDHRGNQENRGSDILGSLGGSLVESASSVCLTIGFQSASTRCRPRRGALRGRAGSSVRWYQGRFPGRRRNAARGPSGKWPMTWPRARQAPV